MKRYKLEVAYDGTNYSGWQLQNNAVTIEGKLNQALSKLFSQEIVVIGASRTDAGVHSRGNVAVFDADTTIPGDKICYALNPLLPQDIKVVSSMQVADDFHPRFCDTRKTYHYTICNTAFEYPTKRLYSYQVGRNLDVKKMQEAGKWIEGTHDFKSFCAAHAQVLTTVRTVNEVNVWRQGEEIVIEVKGEGFLYNMVRIIAGTLIRVGEGYWEAQKVKEIIEACDRTKAGPTAPAKGLCLQQIEYLS